MVRGQRIDRTVEQPGKQRFIVRRGAQGRIHFEIGVIVRDIVLVEQQVVRRYLAGDADAVLFGPADDVESARGGDMLDMDARPCETGQLEVAGDADFLAAGGDARDAEFVGARAFVHRAAAAEFGNFAMAGDKQVEVARIFQRAAEKVGIGHGIAVIGDHDRTLAVHVGYIGQLLSGAAFGDATRCPDRDGRLFAGQGVDKADQAACIDRRIGIGHGNDAGESTTHGGTRAGGYGLLVLASGFAQVNMHIEEAGEKDLARAIDDGRAGRHGDFRCHFFHSSLGRDEDVEPSWRGVRRVDGLPAAEKSCFAHETASSFSSGKGATAGCNQ